MVLVNKHDLQQLKRFPIPCSYIYFTGLPFSIVLERYFRFETSLLSFLCMLIARIEMGTSRVSGDSDIIT